MKIKHSDDVLMILPRKTIRKERAVPDGWEVDQDASGLSLSIHNRPVSMASWKEETDFGTSRPAIHFTSIDRQQEQTAFEVLVSRLSKAFDKLPSRYPLYIRLRTDQLDLIVAASRMGFIPYFGIWKNHSADDSESLWEHVTDSLRALHA